MANKPKRQHHLAQTIQRNFLEKGADKLWWYSRAVDKYEERTPYGIAHGRHAYTFSAIEGDERYTLERAFSVVESKAGPALKKLESLQEITQDEHNAIAEFVGFQFLRTPSKIALIQKIRNVGGTQVVNEFAKHIERMTTEEFATYIDKYETKTGNKMTLARNELINRLKNRPPKVTSTKEGTLESLVRLGTDLSIEYSERRWTIMHAPQNSRFITSSEGVFIATDHVLQDLELGPAAPGVSTIFPFSRRSALVIEGAGPITIEHSQIDKATVRIINDSLAAVSGEIYGSPRQLLESIVKNNKLATTDFEIQVDVDRISKTFSKHIERNASEAFPSSQ